MYPSTRSITPRRRRRNRLAAAAALLLIAEAGIAVTGQAAAAPAPERSSEPAKVSQPSKAEILEADMEWAARHAQGSKAWAILEAKKTGKKVVAYDETTATSYTVANPDGTLTTDLTSGPERVWRGGKWRTVDVTLTRAGDGSVKAKEHPNGLRLAGKGGAVPRSLAAARDAAPRDLVTLGSGDQAVTLQWKGGLPAPELNGTTARYREAVPGADVIVEATRTGFEQFVEIAKRPSGSYSYTLPVKAKGLKAAANKDGSVTFTDAETGERRATMPAPVMWDASVDKQSGEHTRRARVEMKVVNKGAGRIDLVVTPSANFLADPETQYPVTVDPSTSALAASFDTYVQRGETVDWSTDTELDFGNPGTTNADGTTRVARSFIHWNTTPIQDALIIDTNLALWNFHSGNTDCTAQSWTIWDTTAASTSSRWTNQPTWNQQYHSSTQTRGNPDCAAAQPDGWINADVDALVQTWASAKATRGYMGLRAASDDTRAWKRVSSGNATSNQPKLTVTYNYRPSDGTDRQAGAPFKSYAGVWAVNTTTPTLRDTFTDPDGDTVSGTFQVYDAATNTPITTPAGEGLLVSDFGVQGKPVSVTVPAGQLQDGKTYKFRTNAYDGTHYNLSWSAWTEFVVDTTAPTAPSPVTSSQYPEGWVGGGSGTPGTWTATTTGDSRSVEYRLDGSDADPETGAVDSGTWSSVNTTTTSTSTSGSFSVTPTTDGNHTLEVRSVDRADNVGTSTAYGFVAGSANTGRAHKVDITLPTPNTTAVDPAYSNAPMPAFGWKGWETLAPSSRDGGAPTAEARTFKSGNLALTVTPLKQRTKEAAESLKKIKAKEKASARSSQSPLGAAAYTGPVISGSWCDTTLVGQKSMFTRDEACLLYDWTVTVTDTTTSTPKVYRQSYELMWQVKLNREGDQIQQWIQMTPISGSSAPYLPFPAQPGAINFNMGAVCPGTGCTEADGTTGFDWEDGRSPTWAGSLDSDLAQGNATLQWNGSVTDASGAKDVDLSKTLPLSVSGRFSTQLPGVEVPVNPDGSTPVINARCDKVAFTNKVPGCVFPGYVPGFALNSKKFPAAAAHAWLIQNKLAGNYGRDPLRPLMYLPKATRNSAGATHTGYSESKNRYRICYGINAMVYHPQTGLVPELSSRNSDKKSCDEYPFNATYQSAGMPTAEGGLNSNPVSDTGRGAECVQTYAPKLSDGTWKLYDDERYAAPTWDEPCGRSSMSNNVNTQAMSRFGTAFVPEFRMLDRDAYWIDIEGLENCDAAAETVKCIMTP